LIGVAGALLAAAPAVADVRAGVTAWGRKDYAAAIAEWRGPAKAGDADAQYNMGQAYRRGEGVVKDADEAENWYRKAAGRGHPQAQAALGLLLFQSGDKTAAMPWFQKAAARGEPRAQYVVGTALFNGDGTTKDWPRAYAMMSRAAAAGLQPATLSLAQMEKYLSATEKREGATLAKTLAKGETLSAAVRRSRATAVGGTPVKTAARGKLPVEPESDEDVPVKGKTKAKPADEASKTASKTKADPKAKPADAKIKTADTKPKGKTAAEAPAKGWKVQLGAFGAEAAAKSQWGKLAKTSAFGGLTPAYVARGGVVRLQAGPFRDKAAANRACTAAAKVGGACFPIAP
jgi:TPR repeat protein